MTIAWAASHSIELSGSAVPSIRFRPFDLSGQDFSLPSDPIRPKYDEKEWLLANQPSECKAPKRIYKQASF